MDAIGRFWRHVDKSAGSDGCWPWTAHRNGQGYGVFAAPSDTPDRRYRTTPAARWLLGYLRGAPLVAHPRGLEEACHRCDSPPCVNPAHLYVGTRSSNMGDAVERRRLWMLKRERCPRGHEYRQLAKRRYCPTCESLLDRRTKRRTHCRNGHELAGDNVLMCKNGTRKCRICDMARATKPRRRMDKAESS